jgi:hypothetical protein
VAYTVSLSPRSGQGRAGWPSGAGVEQNLATIQSQIDANRELSASLSYDA